MQVTRCVPQGSLQGPLLFIVFVNGLRLHKTKCETFGYAGDLKLVATNSENKQYDINPIEDKNKSDIKQIERWCLNNKMTKNENGCCNLPIKSLDKCKLSLNNKNFTLPEQTKRSGHYNVAKLNWKPNVKKKWLKALKLFYFSRRNTSPLQNWEQNSMRTQDLWYQLLHMQREPVLLTKVRQRRLSAMKGKLPFGSKTTGNWITRRASENTIYFLSLHI